jgi:hydrogenase nickel incorporation protein HypA/HybF
MHEFSIAMNIVDIATDYAMKENAASVREIEIEVGEISGVVLDALEFCLDAAVKDSVLEGAERKVTRIPGKARCRKCAHEFPVHDLYTLCPKCGCPAPQILQGSELRVKSLLVE